jgi:hypothetical protein
MGNSFKMPVHFSVESNVSSEIILHAVWTGVNILGLEVEEIYSSNTTAL